MCTRYICTYFPIISTLCFLLLFIENEMADGRVVLKPLLKKPRSIEEPKHASNGNILELQEMVSAYN